MIVKSIREYNAGRVTEAILLVSAKPGYEWFNRLFDRYPTCLARERIRFINSDGTPGGQAKVGSAFFYFGANLAGFGEVFGEVGWVVGVN